MTPREPAHRRIQGLYLLADAAACGGDPVPVAARAIEAGCRLVQVRCKGWPTDELVRVGRQVVAHCRRFGATCIVNDDPQAAAAAGADGVHLGQHDGDPDQVRRLLGPDAIVGRSTNTLDELAAAIQGADYVAFGPVFDTPHLSRPKPTRGLERLALARAAVPAGLPLVAIGGITAGRLPAVRAVGVDAWAVIGAVCNAPDVARAVHGLLA